MKSVKRKVNTRIEEHVDMQVDFFIGIKTVESVWEGIEDKITDVNFLILPHLNAQLRHGQR